jgi:hypothetical protein
MVRIALIFACSAIVACGATGKHDTAGAGSGSGSGPALYAKKLAISWGIEQNGAAKEDVFLQATDETGKQTSYPLGTYDGICKIFTPASEMKAATGVSCTVDSGGIELHAVIEGETIIVLKLPIQQGTAPDPMSRTEVTRITAPAGSKVEVGG